MLVYFLIVTVAQLRRHENGGVSFLITGLEVKLADVSIMSVILAMDKTLKARGNAPNARESVVGNVLMTRLASWSPSLAGGVVPWLSMRYFELHGTCRSISQLLCSKPHILKALLRTSPTTEYA